MPGVLVVGAGLAGLVAALTAHEAGAEVELLEAADGPGGTSILSTGWIWRYRDRATFRWGAPHGEPELQDAVWHALPEGLRWLEQRGGRFIATGTDNPRTDGVRVDPGQVVSSLARHLPADALRTGARVTDARPSSDGGVELLVEGELSAPRWKAGDAVVFAGGGYAADLARIAAEAGVTRDAAQHWARRNSGLSEGASMDAALSLGARRVPVNGESYVRAMPVGVDLWPDDYVRFSQVYGAHARAVDGAGRLVAREEHDWADTRLVWSLARGTGSGWYLLDREALSRQTPDGRVGRAVSEAAAAGAVVVEARAGDLADELATAYGVELDARAREAAAAAVCAVAVRPGFTHTMCGLRIDPSARIESDDPSLRGRLFAAGVEAGGIATGGYASGLAQAVALGRIAGAGAAQAARSEGR